MENNKIEEH